MGVVIGVLCFIGFPIFLVLGIISAIKKNGSSKKHFIVSAVLLAGIVLASVLANNDTDAPNKLAVNKKENTNASKVDAKVEPKAKEGDATKAKATSEKANQKEQQQAVLDFEKEVYASEEEASPIFDNYQKSIEAFSAGTTDLLSVYNAAETARDASGTLMSRTNNLKTPKNVSKEVQKILNGAKNDLRLAYLSKKDAYKVVLSYIDDQKVSDMSKFQDLINTADQYMYSAMSEIADAKSKVGIKITNDKK
ncbi:hypothetical protein [Paenibacillus sp. IHBB 10380]|uniref:hypothetical protein n=1 Tax=Paenibacillus sp. IHBB 10380 TaxID=1566358 RepID=UPI0006962B7E|nr:hypothetical protein [Paenibacillus sp. IHBB 10380]